MKQPSSKPEALLLLGPTASGKTPLGEILELRGFRGGDCVHFDFGQNLRDIVERDQPDGTITQQDIDLLAEMLRTGSLLEDEHFPVAARILRSFMAGKLRGDTTRIVLNGLPRHTGQAAAIADILDIQTVVELRCSPEIVSARIHMNSGGDRTDRIDDEIEAVRRKLEIYESRTAPLVDYFRDHGAEIRSIDVTADMTAEHMWRVLDGG